MTITIYPWMIAAAFLVLGFGAGVLSLLILGASMSARAKGGGRG